MPQKNLKIAQVRFSTESRELDNLLWQVLYKPLSFPRNIREKFRMKGEPVEFFAKQDGELIGGLVACWTAPGEIEIRHLAVSPEFHGKGIGSALVRHMLSHAAEKGCARVYTKSRNTAVTFYERLGFTINTQQKLPDYPVFKKHGITFSLLELFL